MDKATQTMIDNLLEKTGKTLADWLQILQSQSFEKHGEKMNFLKGTHGLTHGYANLIVHMSAGTAAATAERPQDLITTQYKGKEHFIPVYEKLVSILQQFGKDVELAPKNTYVSVRRKKQFALLNPATKTRFEIGINLKGQSLTGKLVAEKPNAMCSYKISISGVNDIDSEVVTWLKKAYDNAG